MFLGVSTETENIILCIAFENMRKCLCSFGLLKQSTFFQVDALTQSKGDFWWVDLRFAAKQNNLVKYLIKWYD